MISAMASILDDQGKLEEAALVLKVGSKKLLSEA